MKDLVVKDNRLIQASYTLGLVEQRLILLAIVGSRNLSEHITAETILTVRAEDYAKHFGVERQAGYMALADAVETLFNRRATVDVYDRQKNRMRPMTVRWVTAMEYEENSGCVSLRFGHEVIPLITKLEEQFTSYELQQVAGLKSAYAIRLYELLMQWKASKRTPIFDLQEFRRQLGLADNEYSIMGDFKKRVLIASITQINTHTDITVDYEQHKAGRTITGFSFTFTQKKQPKDVTPKVKKSAAKPKATKQEEQLDWMTADILDRFIGLTTDHQKIVIDSVETTLKGTKKARFKVARAGSIKQLVTEFSLDINEAMMTL
ncbi:MAG TPA: replication initiation protein RepM [Agitococcus sp.]|nr:replication initiation protein RepM [Pseudomonadales bacterium]HQV22542.1 replication initiation protein RepM [Agitococcus sp.]